MKPNNSPNLIQTLLKGFNKLGFAKEIEKRIMDITKAQILKLFKNKIGQIAIIKNINENSNPKLFSEDFFFILPLIMNR